MKKNRLKGNNVAPDSKIFTINDKNKTKFAKDEIDDLNANEFENFTVLLKKINEIVGI